MRWLLTFLKSNINYLIILCTIFAKFEYFFVPFFYITHSRHYNPQFVFVFWGAHPPFEEYFVSGQPANYAKTVTFISQDLFWVFWLIMLALKCKKHIFVNVYPNTKGAIKPKSRLASRRFSQKMNGRI